MRFGDSSTFFYQSGLGTLSGPLPGSISEVFLEPPEQLWAPGGVLGATRNDFLRFFWIRFFIRKKVPEKVPGTPPRRKIVAGGCGAALRGNTHFLIKVEVLLRENHTLRKCSFLQPPKQVT